MKTIAPLLIFFLAFVLKDAPAQSSRYIIVLKDKNNNPYSLHNPAGYLSAKSVERRTRQQITIDSSDLPVNPAYLDSIYNAGTVSILNVSKWLNQVLIQTTDPAALQNINGFSFVHAVSGIAPRVSGREKDEEDKFSEMIFPVKRSHIVQGGNDYYSYGNMYAQVNIHEGAFLHNKGFRGEGMTIAILDAGFYHYDTNPAFDSVRLNNQVLGTWDFVANKSSVTEEHSHGMVCFSTIAANRPGLLVGTAPKANFYLFRTEDVATEYPVEEQNWVAAAERADSLGVDLITSSLGYNTFTNPALNHTYADMNGHSTIITRGAEMAVKKGIFVTNSAGNSGTDSWHYIIAPADGEHVLAIGAVNANKQVAGFSSYGPAYDGRIKPNVASVGWGTVIAGTDGNPASASGTSVANPNLAGLITCLWQAFPEFTNAVIFDAVQRSADQYNNPDDRVGYGIPNMRIAYEILDRKRQLQNAERILNNDWLKAYPVPFTSSFTLLLKPKVNGKASFSLYNTAGKKILAKTTDTQTGVIQFIAFNNLAHLPQGIYWLSYSDGGNKRIVRLMK
ncbi:S8 family serine peptidase [Agriterribacter sp.]|uniref:S8 family serine peptidase n=1 Tax=Agriterribacter sp. TaxID=2821509 RepID=UPI002D1BDCEF|nr:S8 family serine peptidase [Agriterribacter sp.]HRO44426.1 S8 family serine peptidase [Agriterribacter sp.]HRQ19213.1 S8 family serine peptidase [Agriterribacter sp.]